MGEAQNRGHVSSLRTPARIFAGSLVLTALSITARHPDLADSFGATDHNDVRRSGTVHSSHGYNLVAEQESSDLPWQDRRRFAGRTTCFCCGSVT